MAGAPVAAGAVAVVHCSGYGCGLFSGALLASVRDVPWNVWAGCVLAGGLLAAVLVSLLTLRWQLQAPGNVQAQLAELQARIRPHFLVQRAQ